MRRRAARAVLPGCPAWRSAFPSRPICLIVSFAPGGPSDIVARILALRMAATLGQPVVVEKRCDPGH
jgi:tripartite-type tricarboxylate transporter receptor subunit TctC